MTEAPDAVVARVLDAYKAALESGDPAPLIALLDREVISAGAPLRDRVIRTLAAERARLVKLRTLGRREGMGRMETVTARALERLGENP